MNHFINEFMAEQKSPKSKSKFVGDFELGKTIGKGTFATVREAVHIPTKQKVAIKILHKKLIVDSRDKLNLSRQLRIIKKLRHPNIAQLLQIMQTNSKIYLVLENIKGGELYQLIVKSKISRLPEQQASIYFQQLLSAVEYLHQLGVTHRDIKPQNILIEDLKTIKLIDFGLSSLYDHQQGEQLTTPCGSPCYAAPEMLSKQPYSPLTVDIWSCGIVLYTMLCGFLPFEHESIVQLCRLIQKGMYNEPNHLSPNSKDILKRMFQVNPLKRLTINQLRKHPFCRSYVQPIAKGLLPSEKFYLDSDIIEQMKSLGFNCFIRDIQENEINQNTAAFYLLLFKKLAQQKISSLAYFDKMIEVKLFKSKSVRLRKPQNPEELPEINKKNMISSISPNKMTRHQSLIAKVIASAKNLNQFSQPITIRIKSRHK